MKPALIALLLLAGSAASHGSEQLFSKFAGNPVFDVDGMRAVKLPDWRHMHIGNPTILEPKRSLDGKWALFIRGTGKLNNQDRADRIGRFYQDAETFSPFGPWKEHENNPILNNDKPYDSKVLLDCCSLEVAGRIYLYYKGRNDDRDSICGSSSSDGVHFAKFASNPLITHVGPSDVHHHEGRYYLYYGTGRGLDDKRNRIPDHSSTSLRIYVTVSETSNSFSRKNERLAIDIGTPGSFESYAVNGSKIFKVSGSDIFFMIYQGSNRKDLWDFPNRFHAAHSTDLIHWTKVKNDLPLLARGGVGEWDEGAIWTGDVFEDDSYLYLYYEGWGRLDKKAKGDRNAAYFSGGCSRTGAARVKVEDFLRWANPSRSKQ